MKQKEIVSKWDSLGLSNMYSSDFSSNEFESKLKHNIEIHILKKLFLEHSFDTKNKIMLDIGAGNGRIEDSFCESFESICAIEPAKKLYKHLEERTKGKSNVNVYNLDLEQFIEENKGKKFDFIFISGILYLLNKKQVEDFILKSKKLLNKDGMIIARDFLALNEYEKKSAYFGKCFYRNIKFWNKILEQYSLIVKDICYSTPSKKNFLHKLLGHLPSAIYYPFKPILSNILLEKYTNINYRNIFYTNKQKSFFLVIKDA